MTALEIVVVAAGFLVNGYLAISELRIDFSRRSHMKRLVAEGYARLRAGTAAGKAPDQRNGDANAAGGGKERLDRNRRHLRKIAERRLACIRLLARIGGETDGCVQCKIGRNAGHLLRIDRQQKL